MGWFDSDNKDRAQAPIDPAQPVPAPPKPSAAPVPASVAGGSTIGARMQIDGTIISEEDLEIVGQVEGTIHAREALSVARDARVKAVVHGRRVNLDGALEGDVHASELVVLGATSVVQGDIHTPSLEIREGAMFRGAVQMAEARQAAAKAAPAEPEPAAKAPAAKSAAPAKATGDTEKAANDPGKDAAADSRKGVPAAPAAGN